MDENEAGIDVGRARAETPGCDACVHFNNAGASLMPQPVLAAVASHLDLESRVGGYEAAEQALERIERVYDSVASLIGCRRDEVALLENATRAWDAIFYSLPLREGDRILTSSVEYAANYIAYLQVAQRTGAQIVVIPDDEHGQMDVGALGAAIDERAKLVAVTHVPTSGGLVNPASEIGAVAREANVPFLLDACQSVGQMPIDVLTIGCDFLSTTGRKFLRGPRGTGFLYVAEERLLTLEPLTLDVRSAEWVEAGRYEIRADARRFETWEASYALQIGLGAAVDYALQWGVDAIWVRVRALAHMLRERLAEIPGVKVHDEGKVRCGIVTFTVSGTDSEDARAALAAKRINVWTSMPDDTRLDFERRRLAPLIRASVHYFNTEKEVELLTDAVRALANRF